MKPSHFLRIASAIALLFALGHTLGAMESWSPQGETPVLAQMKSFRFDAMGVSRTYWDFYFGFGLLISVFLLLQAVVLRQLTSIALSEPTRVRPLVGSFFVASVASALLIWKFIFTVPVLFSIAISICLGLAFFTLPRARQVSMADQFGLRGQSKVMDGS